MSLLSRMSASPATHDVAKLVTDLLSSTEGAAPRELPVAAAEPPVPAAAPRLAGPTGLGTSAARLFATASADAATTGDGLGLHPPGVPAGVAPSAPRATRQSDDAGTVPELYCPPAVRDDPALGEAVNHRLVDWAEETGIYPGHLDKVRTANFGRLIMLAHPDSDDPDRLLAAAKCALAEWAVDDHYIDGEVAESAPELVGERLALAHAVVDPAQLPVDYAPRFEEAVQADPVLRAFRSCLDNLARYATSTQVRRLRHELAIMFVAYNQEAGWRSSGRTPEVWEYMVQRHENSYLPPMVLIDTVGGYEIPPTEFANPWVRRVFSLAGTASVLVNDLYSMAKEDPTDTNLPRLIAAEEQCSLREAVQRTAEIHDELVHAFEAEAAVLSATGSPMLRRFLTGVWAWLGGSREWHRTSGRYHATASA